ncbi:hypothetical protein H8692_09835 [Mogibacterium sp. NSJ-24]|uniref:Alpha-L-glutamate ligase-related protein ATP-grasp domain-containing protein n=1 Tax=Lentihominibacter hominis TaxID=2763645 RepID=A0A926IAE5_9FIRM|nr:sugar-transfer associated ATP-grasp domain-containing protein [Lentihominibacter hominis]MBC8569055.1 hypothetical protein [Lentihominibacter hominis]
MMKFCKKVLKKIKLIVLYLTRIVFVKNTFKVPLHIKLKCNLFGGYLADQYILYDLKHNDRKEFLSEFDWYRSRYINEPFDFAFNNKVICSEILKQYIRMPINYFIKNKNVILDFENGVRNKEAIYECLIKESKLFVKPFALGKGNGVYRIDYKDNKIFINSRRKTLNEFYAFLDRSDEYIICECMEQHHYADELYDKTVNTIRLITMRDIESHEFKIFFAVQRMGRSNTIPVDNGSKGGLVSKIDLKTGVLSEGRSLHDLKQYDFHPDSGKQIKGIKIPYWEGIKKQILEVCKKVPYMDFIAWDLLITDKEVCVIEANTSSGVNILQLWGGQKKGELGEFFRNYGVINK